MKKLTIPLLIALLCSTTAFADIKGGENINHKPRETSMKQATMLTNVEKEKLVENLLGLLVTQDTEKLSNYVTDDAIIVINTKKFSRDDFAKRLDWIRGNTKNVKVTINKLFFDGDQGFDSHVTEVIDQEGKRKVFKIFGYTEFRGNKICRYEDLTIQLEDDEAMKTVDAN